MKMTSNKYTLSFNDNDIGISEENLIKIFNLFTRLHPKSEYPGTGMGLATCNKIMYLHGGQLWAESILHEGSVFIFSSPKNSKPTIK